MAKEVVWTETSLKDRFFIYHFWFTHNHSNTYSEKLELLFAASARLLTKFPHVGTKTNIDGVRIKVVRSFKILYQDTPDKILILRIWDSRQDPETLKL
jgi:plasmid stabilization system protein ParE